MKDRSLSEMLQARIDQINRRQDANRKAMQDAIRRIETAEALKVQASQFFDPSEQLRPIRLSALCAK